MLEKPMKLNAIKRGCSQLMVRVVSIEGNVEKVRGRLPFRSSVRSESLNYLVFYRPKSDIDSLRGKAYFQAL